MSHMIKYEIEEHVRLNIRRNDSWQLRDELEEDDLIIGCQNQGSGGTEMPNIGSCPN